MVLNIIKSYRKRLFRRKALRKRTFPYFLWRFGANGLRTMQAATHGQANPGVISTVAELRKNGIIVGPNEQFLSESGRESLKLASSAVLAKAQASELSDTLARGRSDNVQKDFMIPLVPWDMEHNSDSPYLKLALDPKLLEIVSGYLGMWPLLHAVEYRHRVIILMRRADDLAERAPVGEVA